MSLAQSTSSWRIVLAVIVLLVFPCVLLWHLVYLQVVPGQAKGFQFLQKQSQARSVRNEVLQAYRGVITDRHGEPLAVSTPLKSLYINPQKMDVTQLQAMADLLNLSYAKLKTRLQKYRNKQFVYLKKQVPPHLADTFLKRKFSGVGFQTEFRRYYPAGEVTAHILGMSNHEDRGQEGIELAFDDWLAGKPGYKQVIKNLKGVTVKEVGVLRAPESGKDLQLTIDLRLQYLAYRELKAAVSQRRAKTGSLVILDVQSAEILAMVNQPSYNPNNRESIQMSHARNRAITDVFEPGSTMKPFAMMAALESGQYSWNSTIDTHPGYVRVGNKTLLDPKNYGLLDFTTIIKKSSQVGISKLALSLEPEWIRSLYFRTGLGQSTGLGFPGEGIGTLPNPPKWYPIERAALAFGHGLSVNITQLAQAYAVIASKGQFQSVSLVKNSRQLSSKEQVIAPHVAQSMISMLRTVVEPGGTATQAQIKAYPVAGKTGTAHKVQGSGYAEDKYNALFAGMAPAHNPKIVAVVFIGEPTDGKYHGGESAAPVFANVVENALRLLNVAPLPIDDGGDSEQRVEG